MILLLSSASLACNSSISMATETPTPATGLQDSSEHGGILALAIDPLTPTTLYAATDDNGVFKSVDSGGNWNPVNTGLTTNWINVLTIDPVTPSTLYAGTGNSGVFKSTDGGESWYTVNTGLPDMEVIPQP